MSTKLNLVIDQGVTWSSNISMTDANGDILDLTSYVANSQIRKHAGSTNISENFTTAINVSSGVITLSLSANQTSNLSAGRYVYDLETTDSLGSVARVQEGIVTVTPGVTR